MSGNIHNGLTNFDSHLKNVLDNYQHAPNTHIWGKLKYKLFKKEVLDFVSFRKLKRSFNPQTQIASVQAKVWISYAAAACLTIGIAFGAVYVVKNELFNKVENTVAPAKISQTLPPVAKQSNDLSTQTPIVENKTAVVGHQDVETPKKIQVAPAKQDNSTNKANTSVADNNSNPAKDNKAGVASTKHDNESAKPKNNVLNLLNYIQKLNPQNSSLHQEPIVDQNTETESEFTPIIEPNTQENSMNPVETIVYNLEIPNVFTPNGDGFNDMFVIKNLDKYPENSLLIADRNGKIVYERNSYMNDWDAQSVPDGTYYYILSYKDKTNSKGLIKGPITIVRSK